MWEDTHFKRLEALMVAGAGPPEGRALKCEARAGDEVNVQRTRKHARLRPAFCDLVLKDTF